MLCPDKTVHQLAVNHQSRVFVTSPLLVDHRSGGTSNTWGGHRTESWMGNSTPDLKPWKYGYVC